MEQILGHPVEYWIELDKKAKELDVAKLIEEIVRLKAKLEIVKINIKIMDLYVND